MKRILFVDDEPQVLKALQCVLHRERLHWEMVFVDSAVAALVEMTRREFDVVVSDARMPEVDGPELLLRIAERWPHARRVLLSGGADLALLARAGAVAHQCISKPCDAEELRAAIDAR